MPVEKLPLVFHPGILKRFGEDLVSDPIIALSELVKNGYDADADSVTIEFIDSPEQIVKICDDGDGMTLQQIAKGWLTVGTPLKRMRSTTERKHRAFAGSMGIARWAAYSLCDSLEVKTSTGDAILRKFSISMSNLIKEDKLETVNVDVTSEIIEGTKKGTTLILSKMKWWPNPDEVIELKHHLSFLCGPRETEDFKITIVRNGIPDEVLPEKDLPEAPIQIHAEVLENGTANITIKANRALYKGNSEIPPDGWPFSIENKFLNLRNIKMDARWYVRGNRPDFDYWKDTEDLPAQPGIRLYRDLIRVLPYGEPPEFDWLGLEEQYTKGGAISRNPRPSQLIGWILFSRETNPELQDTAGREGLKETRGKQELVEFGQLIFQKLAEVRKTIEPVMPKGKEPKKADLDAIGRTLRKLRKQVQKMPELKDDFVLIGEFLRKYRGQAEVTAIYRDRLTSGNLVNLVTHDVGIALKPTISFIDEVRTEKCSSKSHEEAFDSIATLFLRIDGAYELLRGASRPGAYRLRSNVQIEGIVNPLVDHIRLIIGSKPIKIECHCQRIRAKIREADVWAIAANLLLNAVTCSEFDHARGRSFPENREIIFNVSAEKSDLVIECEDNGPGLPDQPEGWIWEPFNSTRGKGGSGLGLFIVAQATIWYGGTYEGMPAKSFKSGARFRIVLPNVVTHVK